MLKHGHGRGGRKALTPEQEEKVTSLRKQGFTRKAIATLMEVHFNTIKNVCQRQEIAEAEAAKANKPKGKGRAA